MIMNRKGITLVALIVTIIVLLILAGITINLTIGQDGIIKRAQEAGKNYIQAAEKEKTELAEFSNFTDKIIDNVTKNHYTMVDGVPVPKGFSYKEGTKDTGFVIKNDTDGNEFVWVPCTIDGNNNTIKYDRYAFTKQGWEYTQTKSDFDTLSKSYKITRADVSYFFTETMPTDEEASIKTYGGFYIARFESGIIKIKETSKLVIKKGQQVWNYINQNQAKTISQDLYKKAKGDSVNSKLCSSYSWDTALKFIETKYPSYAIESEQGNYTDKSSTLGQPAITGETEAVNNIYDMGGNVWEWTTEQCIDEQFSCTRRGGNYLLTSSFHPAAYRDGTNINSANEGISFRVTLFL